MNSPQRYRIQGFNSLNAYCLFVNFYAHVTENREYRYNKVSILNIIITYCARLT